MSKIVFLKSLRELLTPLKRLIDKKAENVNWNENDPSSNSYIANRPFYSETKEVITKVLPEITYTAGGTELVNLTESLVEGRIYTVTWDGVSYDCVARNYGGYLMLGNNAIYEYDGGVETDTGEPFAMETEGNSTRLYIYTRDQKELIISISYSRVQKYIHKIPSEYLPEISSVGKEYDDMGEIFNNYSSNIASGDYSHAEGDLTSATSYASHAEGSRTSATGYGSHAEGESTQATSDYSHAEGYETIASGWASHAEGYESIAANYTSHAEGYSTLARSEYQHVQGKYNIEDISNKYAHIVGNGSYSERKNAHTLDWNGLGWFAGGLKVGGASQDDESAVNVATINDFLLAKDSIAFIDQVNGYTYIACMRDGNFVTYCGVKSIKVTTMPSKTEYMVGDYLDPTGMVVTATCYDGTTKEIANFICSSVPMVEGDTFTEITYKEAGIAYTTIVPITVSAFDPTVALVDFEYTANNDGTYTITSWKGTLNGEVSTELIVPNNNLIVV